MNKLLNCWIGKNTFYPMFFASIFLLKYCFYISYQIYIFVLFLFLENNIDKEKYYRDVSSRKSNLNIFLITCLIVKIPIKVTFFPEMLSLFSLNQIIWRRNMIFTRRQYGKIFSYILSHVIRLSCRVFSVACSIKSIFNPYRLKSILEKRMSTYNKKRYLMTIHRYNDFPPTLESLKSTLFSNRNVVLWDMNKTRTQSVDKVSLSSDVHPKHLFEWPETLWISLKYQKKTDVFVGKI